MQREEAGERERSLRYPYTIGVERRKRRWPWALAGVVLLAACWTFYVQTRPDEFAFLQRFNPRPLELASEFGDLRRHGIVLSRENASEVAPTITREMSARGWKVQEVTRPLMSLPERDSGGRTLVCEPGPEDRNRGFMTIICAQSWRTAGGAWRAGKAKPGEWVVLIVRRRTWFEVQLDALKRSLHLR